MWAFLIGLIDPISKITQAIAQTKIAQANALTNQERIAAEERSRALEAKRDVLVGEAPFTRLNAIIRSVIGSAVAAVLLKLFVWDKALGEWTGGRTEQLSPELWQTIWVVLGFYFMFEAARVIRR